MTLPILEIHRFNSSHNESVEARSIVVDLVERYQRKPCASPSTDARGRPIPVEGLHWSVAHKEGLIAAIVASHPIGIDIEPMQSRNIALFHMFSIQEWQCLPERTWLEFYRLWTAKEALSKKVGIGIDALTEMQLVRATNQTLLLSYRGESHPVRVNSNGEYVVAYTV